MLVAKNLCGVAVGALLLCGCSLIFGETPQESADAGEATIDAPVDAPSDAPSPFSKVDCGSMAGLEVSDFRGLDSNMEWTDWNSDALLFEEDLGMDVASFASSESTSILHSDFSSGALAMDMRVGDIPLNGGSHITLKLTSPGGTDDAAIQVYAQTISAFAPGGPEIMPVDRLSSGDYRVRIVRHESNAITMEHSSDGIDWVEFGDVNYNSAVNYKARFSGHHDSDFVGESPQPLRLRAVGESCL